MAIKTRDAAGEERTAPMEAQEEREAEQKKRGALLHGKAAQDRSKQEGQGTVPGRYIEQHKRGYN